MVVKQRITVISIKDILILSVSDIIYKNLSLKI